MTTRLLICIPCHNRRQIVEQCVPTVCEGMRGKDVLNLYNDGSHEYGDSFLFGLGANNVTVSEPAIGIERQRKIHFGDFDPQQFSHLYLADSDALHDPSWREKLLALQEKYGGAPVCGYNTAAHERLVGNTISETEDAIWRQVAPGISYLLTAEHVAKIRPILTTLPPHWNWDWTVPALLGIQFVISKTSYVDHIGHGGLHDPGEGYDGGDRATNPTPWLVAKRAEVVAKLKAL